MKYSARISSNDPRIVLGLAKHEKLDQLEIKWPQPSGQSNDL
jgi:hypothetical protein